MRTSSWATSTRTTFSATAVRDLDVADPASAVALAALVTELRERTRRDMRGEGLDHAALSYELTTSGYVGDESSRLVLPLPADEPIDATALGERLRAAAA